MQDLLRKIEDLQAEVKKVGLKINIEKTKDMRVNNRIVDPVSVGGQEFE